MGVGFKAPVTADCAAQAGEAGRRRIMPGSSGPRRACPSARSSVERASQLYRSKGERRQIADYYAADFTIDVDAGAGAGPASEYPRCARWRPAELDSEGSPSARSRG